MTATVTRQAAARMVLPADAPRDRWLAARRTGLGGSDTLAVLGLDRWSSRIEVYLDKVGKLPERPETEAMRWGRRLEPVIADWFTETTGLRTRKVGLLRSTARPWQIASLDRQVLGCPDGPCLLECKNTSVFRRGEWDDDQVADAAEAQAAHYLAVTGYGHAHVAVLIGGNSPEVRRVDADPGLIADLNAVEAEFWSLVQDRTPPALEVDKEAVTGLLERLHPLADDGSVELAGEHLTALAAYRIAGEQIKELEAARTAARNTVVAALGDREAGLSDGQPVVTYRNTSPFSEKRFRQQFPDLAKRYTRTVEVDQLDVAALAADHPTEYRACRSRRFLPTKGI